MVVRATKLSRYATVHACRRHTITKDLLMRMLSRFALLGSNLGFLILELHVFFGHVIRPIP